MTYAVINMYIKLKNEGVAVVSAASSSKFADKLKFNNSYFDENLKKTIKYKVKNVTGGSAIMLGAGVMSGLLGIGSGIFKVIAMDTVMKMPLKPSSATSNFMMGVTAAASAIIYFLNGMILPDIAVPVCLGVILGAILGTRVMPKLNQKVLRVLFIIVMLFFCFQMAIKAVTLF